MIDRTFVQAALVPFTYRITVMRKEECIDKNVMIRADVISVKSFALKIDGHIHLGKIIDVTKPLFGLSQCNSAHLLILDSDITTHMQTVVVMLCGGLSRCDSCGFGCGGGFSSCGCGGRGCSNCGCGGWGGGGCGWGVELGFGFIFGITLAALFFI